MDQVKLGIIGCGNISDAYLKGAARSRLDGRKACADLDPAAAAARADAYGVAGGALDELLADPEIAIVINLTVPTGPCRGEPARGGGRQARLFREAARARPSPRRASWRPPPPPRACASAPRPTPSSAPAIRRPGARSTRAGSAGSSAGRSASPGPAWRAGTPTHPSSSSAAAARCSTSAAIRSPSSSTASARSRASSRMPPRPRPTRTVTSEPRRGEVIEVEVPTTVNGVLDLRQRRQRRRDHVLGHLEARAGCRSSSTAPRAASSIPTPTSSAARCASRSATATGRSCRSTGHPFGQPNRKTNAGLDVADYRMVGVLDMACAIAAGPAAPGQRRAGAACAGGDGGARARSVEGRRVRIETICARPEPVPLGDGEEVFCLPAEHVLSGSARRRPGPATCRNCCLRASRSALRRVLDPSRRPP